MCMNFIKFNVLNNHLNRYCIVARKCNCQNLNLYNINALSLEQQFHVYIKTNKPIKQKNMMFVQRIAENQQTFVNILTSYGYSTHLLYRKALTKSGSCNFYFSAKKPENNTRDTSVCVANSTNVTRRRSQAN